MSTGIRDLAPAFAESFAGISQLPFIAYVNETAWIFAVIETAHLLFLAVLGGAVLILNLRLLGATLGSVPVQDVERATRSWLATGIVGSILTGIAMGITTVNTLLSSGAFLIKMVALVAAILFSLAVAREARHNDTAENGLQVGGGILAIIASVWWLASLGLFITGDGLGSGAFLIALTGFALFAAFVTRWRRIYVFGLVAILGGGHLVIEWLSHDDTERGKWLIFVPLAAAFGLVAAVSALERREPARVAPSPARLVAFASTLAWITVAAAGRWIGFT